MANLEKLRQAYEQADQKAIALSTEYDQARQRVRDEYTDRLREANRQAAEAQKAWQDAQVVAELQDRPDGQALAEAFGLQLPGAEDE